MPRRKLRKCSRCRTFSHSSQFVVLCSSPKKIGSFYLRMSGGRSLPDQTYHNVSKIDVLIKFRSFGHPDVRSVNYSVARYNSFARYIYFLF